MAKLSIKNLYLILVMSLSATYHSYADSHVDSCTITGGIYDKTEVIDNGYCASAPAAYEIIAYELYLCSSEPVAPTTTAVMDLSSCYKNWELSSGATLSVQQNATVDVPGTMTRPPNGTYTHGVMLIDNSFGITASLQFDEAVTDQDGNSGVYCGTKSGSGTYGTGAVPSGTSECGASEITAGKFTELLTSFDSGSFQGTAEGENLNGTSASIKGYLIDTNSYLAENDADVDKLIGAATFASPVNFTESTTTITMSFNVGEGMSMYNNGANRIVFGSGPFQAVISTD